MQTIGKYALGVIAGAFIVLLVVRLVVGSPLQYKLSNKEIKALSIKIDSVNVKQDSINKKIADLDTIQTMFYNVINKNNDLITQNNKKLDQMKNEYHEKIHSIDKYTINDLDSFFRTKYARYYNQNP